MKSKWALALLFVVIVIAPIESSFAQDPDNSAKKTIADRLQGCLQFDITVPKSERVTKTNPLKLWIPLPQQLKCQRRSAIEVSKVVDGQVEKVDFKIVRDNHKNEIAFLQIESATKPCTIRCRAKFTREVLNSERQEQVTDAEKYLLANVLIPRLEPVEALAKSTTQNAKSDHTKVEALFDLTLANMAYDKSGQGWGKGSLQHACEIGKGNCTDFHAYFIGHCRAVKLPARFEIGLSIKPTVFKALKVGEKAELKGYHCWAFAALENRWFPVDISETWKNKSLRQQFFGQFPADRVTLSTGRDLRLSTHHKGPVLNYFVRPFAEIGSDSLKLKTEIKIERTGEAG